MSTQRRLSRLEDTLELHASDQVPYLNFTKRDDGPVTGCENNPEEYRGEFSEKQVLALRETWPPDRFLYVQLIEVNTPIYEHKTTN